MKDSRFRAKNLIRPLGHDFLIRSMKKSLRSLIIQSFDLKVKKNYPKYLSEKVYKYVGQTSHFSELTQQNI